MKPLVPLCVALVGCGHVTLEAKWATDEQLRYDPAKYPDDAAVGLYAEDGRLIVKGGADDAFTQQLVHRSYAIQNERAFGLAEVRIPLFGKSQLVSLKARHRRPDGTVRELLESEVIVDESESKDGKAVNGRLFRFPNVEIGSVLEWVYVVELPYLATDDDSDTFGEYPVRHYEAWIEASKEIVLEARFYNVLAQARAGSGRSDRFLRIGLTVDDIAGRPKGEDFAANWTFSQPRWAYRMLRWNFSGRQTPVLATWNDVLARWGRRCWATDRDALLSGFTERLDVSGCTDVRCRVGRAVDWVRERTEYSGIGTFRRMRKATEIVSSKEASAFERALLMRRLLEDADVQASLAAYTARHSEQVDPQFPSLEPLNRLLVFVPQQAGLAQPLWLDPACEHCALGEVSDEAGGVSAMVFRAALRSVGEPTFESETRSVLAPAVKPPERVVVYDAAVQPNGDVTLDVTDTRTGRWASTRCADLRGTSATARRNAVVRDLTRVAATAQLLSLPAPECSGREGRMVERRRVGLPSHGVLEGNRLFVPLTLFDPEWAGTFDEEQRVQPIAVPSANRTNEYRLKLRAPEGWSLASVPKAENMGARGVAAKLETRATPEGAEVVLGVSLEAGLFPPSEYATYRKLGEFMRDARTRVLVLTKR